MNTLETPGKLLADDRQVTSALPPELPITLSHVLVIKTALLLATDDSC